MLASTGATHVVVQINWGAKCFVSVTDLRHENDQKTEVGRELSASLDYLKSFIGKAGEKFQQAKGEKDNWNKLSVKVFGDGLPDNVLTTVDSAVDLIRKMPKLVEKCNGGKGKPVTLHMLPLLSHTEPFQEVPHTEVSKVFRLFSRIDELKRTASEFNYEEEDSRYVQRCEGIVTKIKTIEQKLQSNIKECVLAIRSAECDSERLAEIC